MTDTSLRIGFVGGGNMASAIVGGLLGSGHAADRLLVAESVDSRRTELAVLFPGIHIAASGAELAGNTDVLLLAVKPQQLQLVTSSLAASVGDELIISVAAGMTLERLDAWLGGKRAIIRAMPNQPALFGAGMTVMVGNARVTSGQRKQADYITGAIGATGWVDDESLMDAVTAISGSGPAYFYLLAEALEANAARLGLAPDLARLLARQTLHGAGLCALETDEELTGLRDRVTSPGGTTAAALEALEAAGIRDIVAAAVERARLRSIELGREES